LFDRILLNGTVIDGSGAPRYEADVGLIADRIAEIGSLSSAEARETTDVSGRIVSPGFIDVHNHSEGWLLKDANFCVKTVQGYTTEVLMTDGVSYAPLDERTAPEWIFYLRALDGLEVSDYTGWKSITDFMRLFDRRTTQNTLPQIPYANLRSMAGGFGKRPLSEDELRAVQEGVEQGIAEGSAGLTIGLDYPSQCFASTGEIISACKAMAGTRGLYITHIRYSIGRLNALQEAVDIGRRAGVPVHISHLMGRTPEETDTLLEYVDKTAVHEVDFSFDSIPYSSASTLLSAQLPLDVWTGGLRAAVAGLDNPDIIREFETNLPALPLDRCHIAWIAGGRHDRYYGKTLAEYIEASGRSAARALLDLLKEADLAVLGVNRYYNETMVHPFLAHKGFMLGSDGIWQPEGHLHPRVHGCPGRLLGECVRIYRLFSLEEAVQKMTGIPAKRFGMKKRGLVREGYFADLAVFDPNTVAARADFDRPRLESVGMEAVFVNGTPVVSGGKPVKIPASRLPGRALKFDSL
jgi:N-acyl-D-amino-acid deacylase